MRGAAHHGDRVPRCSARVLRQPAVHVSGGLACARGHSGPQVRSTEERRRAHARLTESLATPSPLGWWVAGRLN